jgi:uncharacterized membrane protein HdeD (DUF308 family)
MHSPDGRVFDVLASAPRAHPTPETEDRQEEDPLRQYREGVESAWANGELYTRDAEQLRELADELRLSASTAANIESEVMGDTIEAILKRQEQIAEEEVRRNHLNQLYAQVRQAHQDRDWQTVVELFEQLRAEEPDYTDPEGLLASARDALEAQERTQRVAALYERGQRHIEAEEWQKALECFEEIQRLEPNYRESKALLAQARQQVSAKHAEKAEAGELSRGRVAGQSTDQAERVQHDYSTDTQPQPPLSILGRNWWAVALAGLINAIHGLLASFVSFVPVSILLLLASLTIATGVFIIIASNTAHPALLLRIQGIISVLAGLVIALSDLTIFPSILDGYTSSLVVICLGIIQMIVAIRLRHASNDMWLLLVSGALLVVSGIHLLYLMYIATRLGDITWVSDAPRLLGIWGLASGILLVVFAFRVRHLEESEVEG